MRGGRRAPRPWTAAEDAYMAANAADGAAAIAEALGRTKHAVQVRASRIGVSLAQGPVAGGSVCPMCGAAAVAWGTPGWAQGVCPSCRAAQLESARDARDAAREDAARAKRARDAERKRRSRRRKGS